MSREDAVVCENGEFWTNPARGQRRQIHSYRPYDAITEARATQNERIPDGKDIEVELVQLCQTGVEPGQLIFPQEILSCELVQPPEETDSKGMLAPYACKLVMLNYCTLLANSLWYVDVRHLLIFTADLGGVSRRKHFIRRKSAHGQAYFTIPLSMLMRYESGCLDFSVAVGGQTVGKGSVDYDHETPDGMVQLD